MEIDIEVHERITAPLQLVWEEIESLDLILGKTPGFIAYDVGPGGQQATAQARLAWGPMKWTLDCAVKLGEVRPREHMLWRLEAPVLALRNTSTFDLTPVGSAETRFTYRSRIECGHKWASKLRSILSEIAEENVHGLVRRTKVKAEQRRLAQERLLH